MAGVALRKKRKKKECGGGKYTSLYWQTERKRGAREEGGGRDVGVRLLKRSKMTGNYISNYRREQERTP